MHIWDLDLKREAEGVPEAKRARGTLPKELMLTHAGHRAPVGCCPYICRQQSVGLCPRLHAHAGCRKLDGVCYHVGIITVHTILTGPFALQVVDFQWNPHDPWTLMSVSDESQMEGGGTLQLWRISDLIHRPEEEVLAEMEANRCVCKCCSTCTHCCLLPQPHEPSTHVTEGVSDGAC